MKLPGLHAEQTSASDNMPHVLSFENARTTTGDTLFEIWNGPTNSDRRFVLDLDGNLTLGSSAAQSGAVRLGNAKKIAARNAAGSADVDVIWLNASNRVELGAALESLSVNGAAALGSTLAVTGVATFGSDVAAGVIRRATADGADNGQLSLTGGGAYDGTGGRGGFINIFGNEHASAGSIDIAAGFVAGGIVRFLTGGNERARLDDDGVLLIGTTVAIGAVGGDVVLANAKFLRAVDVAGTSVIPLIGAASIGGGDVVQLGNGEIVVIGAPGSIVNASANDLVLASGKGIRHANAAGTATLSMIESVAGDYVRVGAGSIVVIGAPATVSSAGAGELVLANDKALRAVNAAGTDTIKIIELNAANMIELGGNVAVPAAAGVFFDGGGDDYINGPAADQIDIVTGGTTRLRVDTGIVLIGTSVKTDAAAGDLVLANAKGLRGVNAAGNDTYRMIAMDANNIIQLGSESALANPEVVAIPKGTNLQIPGASANRSGGVFIDTTNNRLCYYSGGSRYWLAGTAF
jgi:hypothetical protein